jgi:hypothetical protein
MKPVGQVIAMIGAADARAVAPAGPPPGREPAPPNVIRGWLLTLAATRMGGRPETREDLTAEIADIVFTCGNMLAVCWTEETLRAAKGHFEWWPGPAQLRKFLEPLGETARAQAVERSRPLALPARESLVPYEPGPPPPQTKRQRRMVTLDAVTIAAEDAIQARNQIQQLKALGYTPESVPVVRPPALAEPTPPLPAVRDRPPSRRARPATGRLPRAANGTPALRKPEEKA